MMKDYFSDLPSTVDKRNKTRELPDQSPKTTPIPVTTEVAIIGGAVEIAKEQIKGNVEITKEAMRCFTDYMKCREHEKTEQKRIAATLRAITYQIDAQKEVYLKELELNFTERNRLYELAEAAQEKALSNGDTETLKVIYNLILNVYNGRSERPSITFKSSSMFD